MRTVRRYLFKRWYKRFASALMDGMGAAIFFPWRLFKTPKTAGRPRKILVIRLDHVGDVVMTLPTITALHQRFPNAQIDILVSEEIGPLVEDFRGIGKAIGLRGHWFDRSSTWGSRFGSFWKAVSILRKGKYDVAIDFRGDLRNIILMFCSGVSKRVGYGVTGGGFLLTDEGEYSREKHQVYLNFRLLDCWGFSGEITASSLTYSKQKKERYEKEIGVRLPADRKSRIVIHAGAGYPSKRWPWVKYLRLMTGILDENLGDVVLIGTAFEKRENPVKIKSNQAVDLRGETRLEDLPILMDQCDLFVGNDSGPAHIAAAQGTPSICLFSGTNEAKIWHPWGRNLNLLNYPVPCSPCGARKCPKRHHDCLEKIEVEEVLQKIRQVLNPGESPMQEPEVGARKGESIR